MTTDPTWFQIVALSVVEGITEFLPVSSTGHMVITNKVLGIPQSAELEAFLVIVQAGAILAVVSVYWKRFWGWLRAWLDIFSKSPRPESRASRLESLYVALAVVPFGVVGFLLKDVIDGALDSVRVVAAALIMGGILILVTERFMARRKAPDVQDEGENVTGKFGWKEALIIGSGQCLALWPGFSRSAATIIVSRMRGFTQQEAAEISFIVGLPTLLGAASFKAIEDFGVLTAHTQWLAFLGVGIVVSWATAYAFVKWFIGYLRRHSLNGFAYYRLVVGALILAFFSA